MNGPREMERAAPRMLRAISLVAALLAACSFAHSAALESQVSQPDCSPRCVQSITENVYRTVKNEYLKSGVVRPEPPYSAGACSIMERSTLYQCLVDAGHRRLRAELRDGTLQCVAMDPQCYQWGWGKTSSPPAARIEEPVLTTEQERSKVYAEGFEAGSKAEREAFKAFEHPWPERNRRPIACMMLTRECGEADGRAAFLDAVQGGRELCSPQESGCEPVEIERRRAEHSVGENDGYATRLLAYHQTGSARRKEDQEAPAATPESCREKPRVCGFEAGFESAQRAIEEGREACSKADIQCKMRRDTQMERDRVLAAGELERLRRDAELRGATEQTFLATGEKRRHDEAVNQAESLVRMLKNDEPACESTFGEKRLFDKENAVAMWDSLKPAEQAALQDILREKYGTEADDIDQEVLSARRDLDAFIESTCVLGY